MAMAENLRGGQDREEFSVSGRTLPVYESRPHLLKRMGKIEVKLAGGGIVLYPRRESRISVVKELFGRK